MIIRVRWEEEESDGETVRGVTNIITNVSQAPRERCVLIRESRRVIDVPIPYGSCGAFTRSM